MIDLIRTELSAIRPLRDFSGIQAEDHLFDDLSLDSLDRTSLAIELEMKLGIELSDHVVSAWWTVGDVVESLEKACV